MSIADDIEKLEALRANGTLSEEEYLTAKKTLLSESIPVEKLPQQNAGIQSVDVNTWCLLIHLSQFCGYVLPFAGLVVPIILWQIRKNDDEIIDQHGKVVCNWIITEIIYFVISFVLVFLIIGIPLLLALVAVSIAFPIIGAIKANNGEVWRYPLSFKFV